MHHCLQDLTPLVNDLASCPSRHGQQGGYACPNLRDGLLTGGFTWRVGALHGGRLPVRQRDHRWRGQVQAIRSSHNHRRELPGAAAAMGRLGQGVMAAPPSRPVQDVRARLGHGEHYVPEELTTLPTAHPHRSLARLEARQTARSCSLRAPFFGRLHGALLMAEHPQNGVRPHRQGAVPIPAGPRAYLALVQADLACAGLDALLDRPALANHPHLRVQGRGLRPIGPIGPDLGRIGAAAAQHQPAPPARRGRVVQPDALPVIPARPPAACATTQALSRPGGQPSGQVGQAPGLVAQPAVFRAGDGHDGRLMTRLQPLAQLAVVAVDAIASDGGKGHPCRVGPFKQLAGQRGRGGKGALAGIPARRQRSGSSVQLRGR
jgi:hypothetical protein